MTISLSLRGRRVCQRLILATGIALIAPCVRPPTGSAAELVVLSANVFSGVLDDIVHSFESSTGRSVTVSYATAGKIRDRIRSGEPGDVAILTRPMLDQLQAEGKIASGSDVNFAHSHIAVVVRAGQPMPEITPVDSFRRSLTAVRSISYPDPNRGGATGVLFAAIISRLNIAEEIRPKTIFPPPGHLAVELVANGQADWAIAQPMEALRQPGVEIVGPLPATLQDPLNFTFAAGQMAAAHEARTALGLIEFLRSETARSVLAKAGMDPELPGR